MAVKITNGKIPVIFFKEDGKVVAYSPALDLSTCGDTEVQAQERFVEAVKIFLSEITKMGTVENVLTECGWKKTTPERSWSPPTYRKKLVQIPTGAY